MDNSEISAKLNEITLKNNIPVSATIELTYRCPLKCVHCYIPQGYRVEGRGYRQKELTTNEWKRVLKELSKAGCIYLVFTGGEPLLRQDLTELCEYATKLNFDIRIFTTGYRVEGIGCSGSPLASRRWDKVINGFKYTNVSKFEISFYGRREIHNKITQNSDSFDRTLDFAKRVKNEGLRVKLKTTLMKENLMEIGYIKTLALQNGFEYSFDPIITPLNNGDKSNLKHRISDEHMKQVFRNLYTSHPLPSTLYPLPYFFCGAGKNIVGINPYGEVYPCIQLPVSCGNVKENTFAEIWKNSRWLKKWRGFSIADVKTCSTCSVSNKCNRCPGLAMLEDGNLFGPSSLACKLTEKVKM